MFRDRILLYIFLSSSENFRLPEVIPDVPLWSYLMPTWKSTSSDYILVIPSYPRYIWLDQFTQWSISNSLQGSFVENTRTNQFRIVADSLQLVWFDFDCLLWRFAIETIPCHRDKKWKRDKKLVRWIYFYVLLD